MSLSSSQTDLSSVLHSLRKQPGIAIGRLCERDDDKCVICDSYVRPCTLVRVCDECNYGSFQCRCVICGGVGISDAYFISGTKGDGLSLKRLLQAVYHPKNYYLLHLDLEATGFERIEFAKYVKGESVFDKFRNVMVVGKADLVTYRGPTMIASTLHAIVILLKRGKDWDWFINLSALDYPLMSQDAIVILLKQ